jgi:fructose-1-phosphate kinase PfkB-like protein
LILTLTINPAIDRTVMVDKLVFEDRGYILSRGEVAGGRGVNASQVVHALGGKTRAVLTSGGAAGRRMQESLARMGFPYQAVPVRAESRVNLTISDKHGLTIKLNEVGEKLDPDEVRVVRDVVEAQLSSDSRAPDRRSGFKEAREGAASPVRDGVRWLMICGSLQPGVPESFYRELIELARSRGVSTMLDADGDALLRALEAKPTVISPNQAEAERLLGRAILTRTQSIEAVERIHSMGPENVIVSFGSRGAVAASSEGLFEALPPRVDALCPIGAGDALAAAFVWAMDKKKAFYEALRWGVAAGTATAILPGLSFPTLQQVRAIYKQVEVRPAR